MLPESWRTTHLIRFAIVLPVCFTALALTFVARGRQHLQSLVSAFVIFASLGIVGMIALAQETEPGFRYYLESSVTLTGVDNSSQNWVIARLHVDPVGY